MQFGLINGLDDDHFGDFRKYILGDLVILLIFTFTLLQLFL